MKFFVSRKHKKKTTDEPTFNKSQREKFSEKERDGEKEREGSVLSTQSRSPSSFLFPFPLSSLLPQCKAAPTFFSDFPRKREGGDLSFLCERTFSSRGNGEKKRRTIKKLEIPEARQETYTNGSLPLLYKEYKKERTMKTEKRVKESPREVIGVLILRKLEKEGKKLSPRSVRRRLSPRWLQRRGTARLVRLSPRRFFAGGPPPPFSTDLSIDLPGEEQQHEEEGEEEKRRPSRKRRSRRRRRSDRR